MGRTSKTLTENLKAIPIEKDMINENRIGKAVIWFDTRGFKEIGIITHFNEKIVYVYFSSRSLSIPVNYNELYFPLVILDKHST